MDRIYIKNGNVILKDRIISGASIEVVGPDITAVSRNPKASRGEFVIDAKNGFISPGFIDCHIHGEPKEIFDNEVKHGTTAFVVAQSCAPLKDIYEKVENIKRFKKFDPLGANVLGIRLEGPYISKAKAGAQNPAYIKSPDAKELSSIIRNFSGLLKIMTLAPELKGALPLIKLLNKHNIIASIGHSDATYEKAVEGIDTGITHATHAFNAMSGLDRREPGVTGAILSDDRIIAEIILDFIHVHKALFNLLLKLKKKNHVIMITDSLASEIPTGVKAKGGAYRFEDGRLAGSSLTMIGALKNAVRGCDIALPDAINMITLNPAKLLGCESHKGSIDAGKDADIVVFDKSFDVKLTLINGKIVYSKKGFACAG